MMDISPQLSAKTMVPATYMGVWQRTLLESPAGNDDSSLVLWMQTQQYHIDIRIPAARAGIRAVQALEEYTDKELLILASQQGFAGVTHVKLDICQWQREIDFQPVTGARDIGKMQFNDCETLIESGVDEPYLEIWKRLEHSQLPCLFKMKSGKSHQDLKTPAYLMRTGNYVAYARPRQVSLPKAYSLMNAIQTHQPEREQLLDWLDFEISFGEIVDEHHWQIKYTTLPFKENLLVQL
jgi:hypothetical protein